MENIEKFNKNIARLLREKRKELGLSQKEIADRIGITQATYSGWENGQREISLPRYVQIAEILGLDTPFSANPTTENTQKHIPNDWQQLKQQLKQELLAELKAEILTELAHKLLKD